MKVLAIIILLMVLPSKVWAQNNSELISVTINPDNRGIDYSVYVKEKDNERYFENYTQKKGGYWCGDDQEMKIYAKKREDICELKRKNETLLESIYEINPDAFNKLVIIYKCIYPDEAKENEKAQKELMKTVRNFSMRKPEGNPETMLKKYEYEQEHKKYYFSADKMNELTQENKQLATEFNQIEDKICTVYEKIPHSQFELYFNLAFAKAKKSVEKTNADTALKNMATNIKTIKIGADTLDVVISKLGVPSSRIRQDGFETIKYKYDINENQNRPNEIMSKMMGKSMQYGKFVVAEIQSDNTGLVNFISVTKTDTEIGSVDEMFKAGDRHSATSPNSL